MRAEREMNAMRWLRNRSLRKAAGRLADERMREAGGDVDAALESTQSEIGQLARDAGPGEGSAPFPALPRRRSSDGP